MSEAERERVAEELRRVRDRVRDAALHERSPREILPPPLTARTAEAAPPPPAPALPPLPSSPDASPVNAAWEARPARAPAGLRGWLFRLARRILAPSLDAQVTFNSRQVQLDNELLAYLETRLATTHRHYDEVLGIHGRHMAEIDERHLILQEELVAHVHDLVKRIDLVLSEAERGRLGLEFALRELRARLARLEERLPRG